MQSQPVTNTKVATMIMGMHSSPLVAKVTCCLDSNITYVTRFDINSTRAPIYSLES